MNTLKRVRTYVGEACTLLWVERWTGSSFSEKGSILLFLNWCVLYWYSWERRRVLKIISVMSDSPAGTSAPSFSYIEFAPARSRKKRKDRTQRQEPTVTLIQGIRNEMAHCDWFSQSQSPSFFFFQSDNALFVWKQLSLLLSPGIVKEALKFRSVKPSVSVLCLGLGSPSASPNSRAQLSFLIELCAALDIVSQEEKKRAVNIAPWITPDFFLS